MFGFETRNKSSYRGPLPVYMHPVEFSVLQAVVESTQPRRVLEWGSGGSTRAMLAESPFIERYVSIEDEEKWYENVKSVVVDSRLSIHHVPADQPLPPGRHSVRAVGRWHQKGEEDPAVFARYAAFPRQFDEQYDLCLVDGRARNYCMPVGFDLLAPGGVMVIHDAERRYYDDTIAKLGRAVYFEPWHQGQMCLIRKPSE